MHYRKQQSTVLITTVLSIGVCIITPVYAQSNSVDKQSDITAIAPIIIEARLWKEDSLSVPGSVEHIDSQTIASPIYNSVDVLAQTVSNTTIEASSVQTRVVMRGNAAIDTGLQDPVGYFVNDVALPLGGNQVPSFSLMDGITVLKGPQGSTYGRNTESGAIKLRTADPLWKQQSRLSVGGNATDGADGWKPGGNLSIGADGVLSENVLAGTVNLQLERQQGPYFNRLDNNDEGGEVTRFALSAGLNYVASESTDISFKSVVQDADQQRTRFRFTNGRAATPRFETNSNTLGTDDSSTAVHSLRVDHRLESTAWTFITGITDYDRDFMIDLDATPAPLPATQFSLEDFMISQEIRVTSNNDYARSRWLLGLYVYDQETDASFQISPFFQTVKRDTTIDQKGLAGFGQVEYQLADNLDLTLGARVERIEQDGRQSIAAARFSGIYQADVDETEVLPRVALSYQVNPQQTAYLSVARGYLPGGYNYNTAGSPQTFTYQPEYSTNYELGYKARLWQNRVTSQLAVFHTQIKDKQVIDIVPGGLQRISNAAEAEVTGIEWSINALLNQQWSVNAALGWQDAETTDYIATVFRNGGLLALDQSGNQLPLAADYTYAFAANYKASETGLFGSLVIRGSDAVFFDSLNTLQQPSYSLVNAELGYQFNNLRLALWFKNLFDEDTISRAANTPGGTVVEDSNPRAAGFQLTGTW